ncbi:MAG: LysR family transcriptional regulator, partial [Phenylobacterium sp.]|nr:LysR family transcriptional regulator [Phenylobacterium sp.]
MSNPGAPTLDQLNVLIAVVEAGSFGGAARKLNRANSVISYTIGNLETQLGLALFDRKATKKPELTDAGRAMLAEARGVAASMSGLRAKAKGLLEGLEPEVLLVLDVMLPAARVADALQVLQQAFPTVTLRLYMEGLGAVTEMILNRTAGLGVSGPLDRVSDGIERVAIGSVPMTPVAAPYHPLAQGGKQRPGAGRDHVQLVLADRSTLTAGQDIGVIGRRTWRLADLGAKHMLLQKGVGWGFMPVPMVQEDLQAGRLVRLDMPDAPGGDYPLQAIYRSDSPPGPAGRFLID